ncbi:MAG: hypothetical protein SGI91_01905 [Alphaproteobacteria bacterium]|nr:hypothetical protein [Alphaproteobacteria bacterium]
MSPSSLRGRVPSDAKAAAAFNNYDRAVEAVLTFTTYRTNRSQTYYALYDAVQAAFIEFAEVLGRKLSPEEVAAYKNRHVRALDGLGSLFALFSGKREKNDILARRDVYVRLGVPNSVFFR